MIRYIYSFDHYVLVKRITCIAGKEIQNEQKFTRRGIRQMFDGRPQYRLKRIFLIFGHRYVDQDWFTFNLQVGIGV